MANLQYIGARYVPKIYQNSQTPSSYAWESGTSYEALVLVGYQNTSYISRKPVPATVGNPYENPNYWCSMGSFNAQVAQYMAIVAGLAEQMDDFEGDLQSAVNNLSDAIADALAEAKSYADDESAEALSDANAYTDSLVVPLDTRVTNLENDAVTPKILLVGNSLLSGSGAGASGHGWGYYFEQNTGYSCDEIQQNGGDFFAVGNDHADYPNKYYHEAIQEFASNLTLDQRKAYTHVIYGGGINDYEGSYNAVVIRVVNCVNGVKNLFPNAEQILIPMNGTKGNRMNANELRYRTCFEAWKDGAAIAGVRCTNFSDLWFYGQSEFEGSSEDGFHLNNDGYQRMAKFVEAVFNGSDFAFYPFSGGQTYPSGVTGKINVMRSADGIVNCVGKITLPAGAVTANTILVDNVGAGFEPIENIFLPAIWYGATEATRFPCIVTVASTGRIAMRGNFSAYGTDGGTVYLNMSWRVGLPMPYEAEPQS